MSGKLEQGTDRREFLGRAAATGAGVVAGGSALGALVPSFAQARKSGVTKGDLAILGAAQIAEALAVTTYTNIIDTAPFFTRLASDDQGYLKAARAGGDVALPAREGRHRASRRRSRPSTTRRRCSADAQTTLNVLVTLEDAFIAAYLVGVRDFSTADLRVTAARIMGIESDHRTLARVVAPASPRRTAARSRRSPASRARRRASTRPTTTATSARCSGPTSARRSPR